MTKKLLYLFVTFIMIFSLISCSNSEQTNLKSGQNDKLSIITTNFPAYDFVRAVAKDSAEITMLIPPGTESHSFEPTPSDMIKTENCDLFVCMGGESESFINSLLDSAKISEKKVLRFLDCVDGNTKPNHDEMHEGHTEEENYDEHVWTSPKNAAIIVKKIQEKLSSIDKENNDLYVQNADTFISEIENIDMQFTEIVNTSNRKTIVFGDRYPFRHFSDAYGLEYFAAFPGCSEQSEPSAKTIAYLIDKIKSERIPVVFYIEFSNHKIADTLAKETGAKPLLFHSCHNVTADEFSSGKTYIDFMKQNIIVLEEALS